MHRDDLDMTLACLGTQRRVLHYFKDRYAVDILSTVIGDGMPVQQLQASNWAPLLHRPTIKKAIARSGTKTLTLNALTSCYLADSLPLVVQFGRWGNTGDWQHLQTTRPGQNLVVLVCLDQRRVARAIRQLGASTEPDWHCRWHPYHPGRLTVSWARVDIDYQTNTALIEEVQSDFVRYIHRLRPRVERYQKGDSWFEQRTLAGAAISASDEHCTRVLTQLRQDLVSIWPEATLWATIDLLWNEIGVEQIYYHSHAGGAQLKGIDGALPPRSMYSTLPKRFGFLPDKPMPYFLHLSKKQSRQCRKRGEANCWSLPYPSTTVCGSRAA